MSNLNRVIHYGTFRKTVILIVAVAVAVVLRAQAIPFISDDYSYFFAPWYGQLKTQGVSGLKEIFTNYLPYLYFVYFATVLPLPEIVAIKIISISFDFLLAYGVFLAVRHFYPRSVRSYAAALTVLLLPTVILNSAMWSQSDSIFTSLIVFSFYFGLRKRHVLAWIFWAGAIAFKFQAIFFLPWLCMTTRRSVNAQVLLAAAATITAIFFPYVLLGKQVRDIITMYFSQIGQFPRLTLNAANMYQWMPFGRDDGIGNLGIALTFCIVLLIFVSAHTRKKYSDDELLLSAALLLYVIPFFLPHMHERYFYPAEIFTVLVAFRFPALSWQVPAVQMATVISYLPFLLHVPPIFPLRYPALALAVIIAQLTYRYYLSGTGNDRRAAHRIHGP